MFLVSWLPTFEDDCFSLCLNSIKVFFGTLYRAGYKLLSDSDDSGRKTLSLDCDRAPLLMQSIDHRRYAADQRRYLSLLRSTLDEVDTAASLREFLETIITEAFSQHSPRQTSVHHH